MKRTHCCICGVEIENYGNNPAGAVWKNEAGEIVFPEFEDNDRCCDMCDQRYVIPGRIYRMSHREENHEENKGGSN